MKEIEEGNIEKYLTNECMVYGDFMVDWGQDLLAKAIEQYVIKARAALIDYCVHDDKCICSQWRSGTPTEDGDYISTFGYGSNEKNFSKNKKEEPECSCGLSAELKKGLDET